MGRERCGKAHREVEFAPRCPAARFAKAGERAVNDGKKTVEEYADKAKRASDAAKKELNK